MALRPKVGHAMYLIGFPLLVIPFAIYNMIAFLTPGVNWTMRSPPSNLMSGADLGVTAERSPGRVSRIMLLPLEIVKATRIGMRSIVDHVLSMVLFIAMLVEFLLVKQAGTSTFFHPHDDQHRRCARPASSVTLRTAQRDITDRAKRRPTA